MLRRARRANRTKVGLKLLWEFCNGTWGRGANRTKVGLKRDEVLQTARDEVRANRTKVGLKPLEAGLAGCADPWC